MLIANFVYTKNDRNGKPRKGWHVIESDLPSQAFIEAENDGRTDLIEWYNNLVAKNSPVPIGSIHVGGAYEVSPKDYNRFKQIEDEIT